MVVNDLRANFHCGRFISEQQSISKNENATKNVSHESQRIQWVYTFNLATTLKHPPKVTLKLLNATWNVSLHYYYKICHIRINRNEDTLQPYEREQAIKNIIFHLKILMCPSRDVSRLLYCQIRTIALYTLQFSLKTSFLVVHLLAISCCSQINGTRSIYRIVAVVNTWRAVITLLKKRVARSASFSSVRPLPATFFFVDDFSDCPSPLTRSSQNRLFTR